MKIWSMVVHNYNVSDSLGSYWYVMLICGMEL